MRHLSLFVLLSLFVACSSSTPENLTKQVDQLIAKDKYEQALQIVNDTDSTQTKANLTTLREKIHLNYGIFLEYRGKEGTSMRTRMTGALRQYIEVLKINPDNAKAISEVKQIMSIYATMPDKAPAEDVMTALQKLGFNFQPQPTP